MDTSASIIDRNIVSLLGIQGLTEIEQEAFITRIGSTILRATIVDFSTTLTDAQRLSLEQYMKTEPETTALLEHLISTYPSFNTELEKHVAALKTEMVEALEELPE